MKEKYIIVMLTALIITPIITSATCQLDSAIVSDMNENSKISAEIEFESYSDKVLSINTIIGESIVNYWEHVVDNIIIKGDYLLLQLDKKTNEVLQIKKEWNSIDYSFLNQFESTFEPSNYYWKQKICFLDNSDISSFYTMISEPDFPLLCWEVRHIDGTTILYDIYGKEIGWGVPAPSKGLSISGWVMQTDPDNYREFRQNADHWFQSCCTSTNSLSLPTPSTISMSISDESVDYFYVMAHGDYTFFQADSEGSYYFASDLNNDMSNRDPIAFAFIGTCQSMTDISEGSFSYEFRKGLMTDTVTIGFDHMETSPGWQYAYYWQDSLFENMSKGYTIKQSFDMATARYPTIASAVVFLGDETFSLPHPDMLCTGDLTWINCRPGEKLTEDIIIENIGDENSLLSWEIKEHPTWGSWQFNPSNGQHISPGDDSTVVEISVVAPSQKEESFSGEVTIVNVFDSSEQVTFHVSLTTQKAKQKVSFINEFYFYLIEEYPLLYDILQNLVQID